MKNSYINGKKAQNPPLFTPLFFENFRDAAVSGVSHGLFLSPGAWHCLRM